MVVIDQDHQSFSPPAEIRDTIGYRLLVRYKSNERPWSTVYNPSQILSNDEEALQWAAGMGRNMGDQYTATLYKDGQPVERTP